MYQQVFTRLVVTFGTEQVSAPVPMAGANIARVDYTIFSTSANTVTLFLDGSNDLENWELNLGNSGAVAGPTARNFTTTSNALISFQWVRVRAVQSTGGSSVVAAGVNTAMFGG